MLISSRTLLLHLSHAQRIYGKTKPEKIKMTLSGSRAAKRSLSGRLGVRPKSASAGVRGASPSLNLILNRQIWELSNLYPRRFVQMTERRGHVKMRSYRAYSAGLIVALALAGASAQFATAADSTTVSKQELTNKDSAKQANISEAQKLNGTDKPAKKDETSTANSSPESAKTAHDTANSVNKVPGVKVSQKELEPPPQKQIHGFHPIKKLLQPVENLEGMSIKLEQQIMKLEGPIAGLQPPMVDLQKKMVGVDHHISSMQGQLTGMQGEVTGVRSDLAAMRQEIAGLKKPIVGLQKPISGVATPLERLETQLNFILLAILIAAISIAIGTPVAAILIYRNRHRLFPDLKEHELPKVQPGVPTGSRR